MTARSGAIIGGDSRDVTTSEARPERPVGWITNTQKGTLLFGRGCTANPLTPTLVLTAGHCVCVDKNNGVPDFTVVFHLNHAAAPGSTGLVDVGLGGIGIPASNIELHTIFCDPLQTVIEPANYVPEDLALITLGTPLTTTDVPQFNDIYTLPDFLDRKRNKPSDPTFFSGPIQMVGWDTTIPPISAPPVKKIATVDGNSLFFDSGKVFQFGVFCAFDLICSNNAPGIWIHDEIDPARPANRLLGQPGDSGGPILFMQHGTTPTIFGTLSISSPGLGFSSLDGFPALGSFNSWSPTWDNSGLGNGTFISALLDADHDGISDAIDNCAPPRCRSQATCFNPNQADADGDGVGDTCDNCPPNICTNREFPASACANPNQGDLDRDGAGDVCDLCPGKTGSLFDGDSNSDGVGDACDNCPTTVGGGRRACKTNTDCAGRGVCLNSDLKAGRCNDGTNRACGIVVGINCASCTEVGQWGLCSESLESDNDGDGLGNRCDSCPLVMDVTLQQNSNVPAETREGASAVNDACDSTPLLTSRPVVETAGSASAASGRTLFTAYAGVGSDTSNPVQPAFDQAPVGFRHCDCSLTATVDQCLATCGTPRAAFDETNNPFWKLITVGASPAGSFSESQVTTPTLDFRLNPLIYTGGIDCNDPLPHQTVTVNIAQPAPIVFPPDRNLCRLGISSGRLLSWAYSADVAAGRVISTSRQLPSLSGEPQQPQPVPQTVGFFWSHGTIPNAMRAGNRDTAFGGRLRDTYVHVTTPSLSTDVINIPRILIRAHAPGCLQCFSVLSGDWLKALIQPGIGLNVLRLVPRPFVVYPDCVGSGSLCAIRRSTEPHIDLSLVLGQGARTSLLDSTRFFVTPVEASPATAAVSGGVVAVSVPSSWSQFNSTVQAIGATTVSTNIDILATYQTQQEGLPPNVTPFGGEGFVPSDREGARWLFSKLEQAAYMVGGNIQGAPTSEIWRLDLRTTEWRHLFQQGTSAQVMLRNVAGLAYDADSGKLLVVDDSPLSSPQNARVIAFDVRNESSKVVATLDLSSFVKVGLVATGANTFILTGATSTGWTAYRFQITSQNKISWLGRKSGSGFVVADPLPWQAGPALFTQTGQDLDTVDLPPSTFTPAGAPPELKPCDKPLIVPAAQPSVITTCHQPTLHPPTPTSACGPVSVDVVGAPIDFPLGTTTITYSFTDALGNKVTVPQTVTAVLADDASCCPAGTNIIVGTSNNDTLTGTSGADCILGLGAQDRITGGGGDDYISGGDGDDVIDGGSGNDHLSGGSGQDQITGGTGNDIIDGGEGDDTCHGGDGDDIIHGGNGQDHLFGENNNDQLFGDAGDDTLDGGPGNDKLNGGGLHDTCIGGTGTNTFVMCQTIR